MFGEPGGSSETTMRMAMMVIATTMSMGATSAAEVTTDWWGWSDIDRREMENVLRQSELYRPPAPPEQPLSDNKEYMDSIRAMIDADRKRDAETRQCEETERALRRIESERAFNDSSQAMHRDFYRGVEMQRQTDELRRIGNELEELNALERQRQLNRDR